MKLKSEIRYQLGRFARWIRSKRVTACRCWTNNEWSGWDYKTRLCGPDCDCLCHELIKELVHNTREWHKSVEKNTELTAKLFNMEEIYEPAEGIGGGGPLICRCPEPRKLYCRKCRKWPKDCTCEKQRLVCMTCKGVDAKSHGY